LLGAQVSNDLFRVDKVFFPQLPSPSPSSTCLSSKENRSIMFISGLDFTGYEVNDGRTIKCLHLMSKWLSGLLAQSEEERTLIASIARLVIAGGSIHVDETDQSKDRPGCADMSKIISARNFLTRREQRANDLCLKNMDFILSKLTPFVPVDVMPGVGDPTTSLIPQQPIHICCFPRASRYGRMLNMVTNPYEFSLGGQRVLGSSGQNVNDLIKLSSNGTALDRLGDMIRWQHLGPTIPDTIDGFPFRDRDPLVLNEVPRVLFAGCQKRAGHRLLKTETGMECMLLAVPCFARRPIAVILNLATMQVTYQDFTTC